MTPAIALLVFGFTILYAGWHDKSITDVVLGKGGNGSDGSNGKSFLDEFGGAASGGLDQVGLAGSPTGGGAPSGLDLVGTAGSTHKPSELLELFWQGANGIDVKHGQVEPQGFVSGHTDHVHIAASSATVYALGKMAQAMGLHVGENPHFGGVHPVHVAGSYHYKGMAIDVSGPPRLMAQYAHRVALLFGIGKR